MPTPILYGYWYVSLVFPTVYTTVIYTGMRIYFSLYSAPQSCSLYVTNDCLYLLFPRKRSTTKQKRSDDPYEFYSSDDDGVYSCIYCDVMSCTRALCLVIITVSVSDTKQAKSKSSVSVDTTTITEGTSDVVTQDLTPER